jgi:branched-chain amino acid transport system permease protein
MLGAFAGFTFVAVLGLPYWAGVVLAVLSLAVFGNLVDRVFLRPIIGQSNVGIILLTLGLGLLFRSAASMVPAWGTQTHSIETPFTGKVVEIGGVVAAQEYLAIIAGTALLCGALYAFFRHTRLGVAMQAASQNQLAAYYMGIPVKTVFSLIWSLSAAVAAVAGILLAPVSLISVSMGLIGFKALAAAILGGFGSFPGAVIGGVIIGLVEQFAGAYLEQGFKDVAAYVVLLVTLAVKPEGLFGTIGRKKV